jgi:hypothetical protein
MSDSPPSYSGAVELSSSDEQLIGMVHVSIEDLDAAVWSAETTEQIDVRNIDPGGETVMARLADNAHPRSGHVAATHLQLRGNRVLLAGNYGFHAADKRT